MLPEFIRNFVRPSRDTLEHDAWFRARVREALDDPRPGIPHDVVMKDARAIVERVASAKNKA